MESFDFLNLWSTWISIISASLQIKTMPNSQHLSKAILGFQPIFSHYTGFLNLLTRFPSPCLFLNSFWEWSHKKIGKIARRRPVFWGKILGVFAFSLPASSCWGFLTRLRGHGECCCRIHNLPFVWLVSILYPGNWENKVQCLFFSGLFDHTSVCSLIFQN